jgi:hypothetical protein
MNYRKEKKKLTKRRDACLAKMDINPLNMAATNEYFRIYSKLLELTKRKRNEK